LTIHKGFFAPTEIHVQYQKIQDVYVDQDVLDRMMGLYDVHISSATSTFGIEAHIDGVEEDVANNLKTFLLQKMRGDDTSHQNETIAQSISVQGSVVKNSSGQTFTSETYPITTKWLVTQFVLALFHSIWITLVVMYAFFSPGKNGAQSLANSFKIGFSDTTPYIIGIFVILFIFFILKTIIWMKTFHFSLTDENIFFKSGLISRTENIIPYKKVQDVIVYQGFIDKILGFASVKIQNVTDSSNGVVQGGTSKNTIPGQPYDKAQELSEVIRQKMTTGVKSPDGL
jgi:putative membrane protein